MSDVDGPSVKNWALLAAEGLLLIVAVITVSVEGFLIGIDDDTIICGPVPTSGTVSSAMACGPTGEAAGVAGALLLISVEPLSQ